MTNNRFRQFVEIANKETHTLLNELESMKKDINTYIKDLNTLISQFEYINDLLPQNNRQIKKETIIKTIDTYINDNNIYINKLLTNEFKDYNKVVLDKTFNFIMSHKEKQNAINEWFTNIDKYIDKYENNNK